MPVYVDNMRAPFGRMILCHMAADSTGELLAMADAIRVSRKWIQYSGTDREHFDISLGRRALAIQHGAIQLTMREFCARRWSAGTSPTNGAKS